MKNYSRILNLYEMYCTRNPMSSILSKIENFTQLKFEDIELFFKMIKKGSYPLKNHSKKSLYFNKIHLIIHQNHLHQMIQYPNRFLLNHPRECKYHRGVAT